MKNPFEIVNIKLPAWGKHGFMRFWAVPVLRPAAYATGHQGLHHDAALFFDAGNDLFRGTFIGFSHGIQTDRFQVEYRHVDGGGLCFQIAWSRRRFRWCGTTISTRQSGGGYAVRRLGVKPILVSLLPAEVLAPTKFVSIPRRPR
jgi:hypothetical protein